MSSNSSKSGLDDLSFLGRQAERLSDLIAEQTQALFAAAEVKIPVKSCSVMETLAACEPASASDLAAKLDRSHQIVMQKLPKLIELGFIERSADPADKRRFVLRVTPLGREQLTRLAQLTPQIAAAYRAIEAEIGPVHQQVMGMIAELESSGISERVARDKTPRN
ncbi:MarR family winged helix-turn-helix transcriptional regulator [uncultured Erythrobacter sp.]|uniref:MarR family winged helix-turn-helix transcriptional regulator n=1 Tax=uncultured Erythrobacter sp. TaxID=263913 RepID=UPI002626C235|nr:MarR family winged helix-turn-helix transcriptional regulator [uncultured Erythrobacter sp.]